MKNMNKMFSQFFKVTLVQNKRCALLIFALASVMMAYAGSFKVAVSSDPSGAGSVYVAKQSTNIGSISNWKSSNSVEWSSTSSDKFSGTTYSYYKANPGYTFTEWTGNHLLSGKNYDNPHINSFSNKSGDETLVANFVEIAKTTEDEFILYKTPAGTLSTDEIELQFSKTTALDIQCSSDYFTITTNAADVLDGTTNQEVTITAKKNSSATGDVPVGTRVATVTVTPSNSSLDQYTYNPKPITLYITVMEAPTVTFNPPLERGSYTYQQVNIGGSSVPVNEVKQVGVLGGGDDVMKLVATPTTGNRFKRWVVTETNENGSKTTKYSYNATETFTFTKNTEVWAEFMDNRFARFAVKGEDGVFYDDMTEGLNAAAVSSSKVLYVYQSGYLASGNYTIPANVTLLIPGDDANTVRTGDVNVDNDFVEVSTRSSIKCKKYLTTEANTTITVSSNAAISVYAKLSLVQSYNGTPVTYGRLDLGNNCHIVVEDDAVLSALGYILGDPTNSSVTIQPGGTLYESFQLADWRGGNATAGMIGGYGNLIIGRVDPNDEKVFPAGQYYVQNVETKLILESGALEKVATAVEVLSMKAHANAPFVVPDTKDYTSGFFRLGAGTKLIKYYDRERDRGVYRIVGSWDEENESYSTSMVDKIVLTLKVLSNIDLSTEYFTLPIHSGMDIYMDSVIVTASNQIACMPGSYMNIGAEAEYRANASHYVYDVNEGTINTDGTITGYFGVSNYAFVTLPYTPGNTEYENNTYKDSSSPKKRKPADLTDASWVVNGRLVVNNGGFYTTTSGADITSEGNGKVIFNIKGTEKNTYQALQTDNEISSYPAIPISNAQLHNDEAKNPTEFYTLTNTATKPETYTYVKSLGKWLLPQSLMITSYKENEFLLTLPNDVTKDIICIVQTENTTITEDNFKVTYPEDGLFKKAGEIVYDPTTKELRIPIKYTCQNNHNVDAPYEQESLTVDCIDLTSGTSTPITIPLKATEDYSPKFTVSINGTEFTTDGTYPTTIVGFGVDEGTPLNVVLSAPTNNVANELATWENTCVGPFSFAEGDKTETPYATATLTYTPTAAGQHSGSLTITVVYEDVDGTKVNSKITIGLNAQVSLKPNTLSFAQIPQPIYTTTTPFNLIDLVTKNSNAPINVTLNGVAVDLSDTEPYLVTPSSVGVANITVTQSESRVYFGKTISTTISVVDQNIYPVPFCINEESGLNEFNKRLYSANNISFNTINNVIEFNSVNSSSEWIFRFNGTPDKLTFTPTGSNTWNVQQRTSEIDEWKNIATWTNLPTGEPVSYQLEPTTSQIRIQYGSVTPEVGTLSDVCVTELQIAADVDKLYIPIYAQSEKKIVLTHIKDEIPVITFTDKIDYSAELSENLGTASAPYYRTTVTINTTENTEEETYVFTATEDEHTVEVHVNAYNFPQELPINLATDAPANGDRYYYVTTSTSYSQWDAANRQIVFQNPGAQLTRMVTFAFNGAPSIISFDVSSQDGDEIIVDSDWIIEESADGIVYNQTTLPRDSEESNKLVQELKYTTRYVRVKYNSVHTKEIRLSNLVIEGYPSVVISPEKINFTSESNDPNPKQLAVIAINLQEVEFEVDNATAFQISTDTSYTTSDWHTEITATKGTHSSALGINKVDTIFLGVKWLKNSALDEGKITIRNKDDNSVLAVVPLMGSKGYLIKDYAKNSGIYTGIPDGTVDPTRTYTYHGGAYTDYKYHQVDLTNAFAEDGTALFDYLYIYGETTPASGTDITTPQTGSADGSTNIGSNAVTPFYVYKKALNADSQYKGYQFVGKVDNANVALKAAVDGFIVPDEAGTMYIDVQGEMRVYMTGFCPYATTGYTKNQEGVFLFRGDHAEKLDIYLEDFHVYSRNKTQNGNNFYGDKEGGEIFTEKYAKGSGGVFVFENMDPQQLLQNYLPFEVSIHTIGNNLLNSNYGCFFGLSIVQDGSVAMKAYQVSSPIHIHMYYDPEKGVESGTGFDRKTKTTLNFDDLWPTAIDANGVITDTKRTNGFLALKKQANNAPSIDMGNKHTVVNFKGGQVELQNSQIGSDTYKTTLAISHRSGYFGSDDVGIQLCYGIGTDSVGGTVNFLDGTVTVEPMYVKPSYRQYYLMDEENGEETGYTSCLRAPKNTFVQGGSICRVRACQHVTSKGGAPKDKLNGKLLGQYVYTLLGNDELNDLTKLAHIVEFPNNIEGLKLHHENSGYTYGLESVTPDNNDQYYFWIPDGYGGVTAEQDKLLSTWKACMTEIGAGLPGLEGRVGGDTPIEPNEEVKYFLYCQIDQNILDVISAGEGEGELKDYSYQPPFEVPSAAKTFFNDEQYARYDLLTYVSDSLQYQVVSDTAYTITDRVYYVTTATADVWKTFTAPFDVANIYVVEAYSEEALQNVGTRTDILIEQARHNADFAAFFAVAMAMGTDNSFEEIYQSYIKWAKTEDNHSDENGKYTLRGMQKLTPYFGNNWRDANFYLNVNKGNWELTTDEFGYASKWEMLNQNDTTDGILLHKGQTYSLMFPYCPGCDVTVEERTYWDYWSGKFIIFESTEAPQTINGRDFLNETKESNIFTLSPDENQVIVTGNSTFARLETDREDIHVYEDGSDGLGGGIYNSEYFSMKEDPTDIVSIQPTTAFLYGNVPANQYGMPAKKVTREGKIVYGEGNNGSNPQGPTTGTHTPTVGGGNDMFITAIDGGINIAVAAPQMVCVVNATGHIIYSGYVADNVDVLLPMNGIYVVKGENEAQKIFF